jgi:N-acetylglucosamine-6-sulfatase
MKRILLLIILSAVSHQVLSQCNLQLSAHPVADSISSCSARIRWNAVPEAAYYQIRYMTMDEHWSELINVGTDTVYTLTNLIPGAKYFVGVAPYCDSTFRRGIISGMTLLTDGCELPQDVTTTSNSQSDIEVMWNTHCSVSQFNCRYRLVTDDYWNEVLNVTAPFSISGLIPESEYEIQIQSVCADLQNSDWSESSIAWTLALIDTAGTDIDSAGTEIDSAGTEIDSAGTDIDSAGTEIDSAGTEIDSAGTEIDSAGTEIDSAGTDIDSAGTEIDSAGTEIDSAGTEIDSAGTEIDSAGTEIDSAGTEIDSAGTEIDSAGTEIDSAGTEIDSAGTEIDSAGTDIDSAGTEIDSAGTDIDSAGTEIDSAGTEIGSAGTEIDSAGTEVDSIGTEIDSAGTEIDSAGTEIDSAGTEIDSAGTETDSAGTEIDSAGTEIDSAGTEIDSAGIEIDSSGTEIDSAGTDIDSAGTDIDSAGTDVDSIASLFRPNIIMIIADDMSQKTFIETGGPSWFETPSISRIANEGINFLDATVTLSLCAPSRATIFTGLYSHHTGITANQGERLDTSIATVGKILHSAGYHTGFIGKFHVATAPHPGYDFWLAGVNGFYGNNPKFNLNGQPVVMEENFTSVVERYTNEFIRTAPQPFFLIVAHVAPHAPYIVQPQDDGKYDDMEMPLPPDFYKYTQDYPNFLYPSSQINITDSAKLADNLRGYFESTMGIEHSTDTMLSILDSIGITDSTMIIFTSDNGYLFGEHQLYCKRLAYEESLKVPLFIRYPQWFAPNTVDSATMALNVDLCPTILDAAGIPDTFGLDGTSLHFLVQNRELRPQTMFQYEYNPYGDGTNIPSFRGIRSREYKYVRYACENATEEFFDTRNDPFELTNRINDTSYAELIDHYRYLLDSTLTATGDTGSLTVMDCYLTDTEERLAESEEEGELDMFRVYPQPAKDNVFFELRNLPKEEGKITYVINNAKGEFLTRKDLFYVGRNFRDVIDITSLVPGVYMVKISDGMSVFTSKLTVGH